LGWNRGIYGDGNEKQAKRRANSSFFIVERQWIMPLKEPAKRSESDGFWGGGYWGKGPSATVFS
jgi:hypothetical protein